MSQSKLDKETFLILARQAGFEPADPHLADLFPDVQLMLDRMDILFDSPTDGLEPGYRSPESAS